MHFVINLNKFFILFKTVTYLLTNTYSLIIFKNEIC
jgi:hypothetical protein